MTSDIVLCSTGQSSSDAPPLAVGLGGSSIRCRTRRARARNVSTNIRIFSLNTYTEQLTNLPDNLQTIN